MEPAPATIGTRQVDATKLDNSHCLMVIDTSSILFFFAYFMSKQSMQAASILLAAHLHFRQMLQRLSANHLLPTTEAPPDAGAPVQTRLARFAADQIRNCGKSICTRRCRRLPLSTN